MSFVKERGAGEVPGVEKRYHPPPQVARMTRVNLLPVVMEVTSPFPPQDGSCRFQLDLVALAQGDSRGLDLAVNNFGAGKGTGCALTGESACYMIRGTESHPRVENAGDCGNYRRACQVAKTTRS